jgi:large subunit ribosomal protein L9
VKLVLREDVPNLGRRGEVVRVADGYGRNYLLPKKLAYPATPGTLKQIEIEGRARLAKEAEDRRNAEELVQRLAEMKPLLFTKKVGEEDTLYGSVTVTEIAEALLKRGFEFDRRKIQLPAPIKKIGTFQVGLHLFQDIVAEVVVEVEPEL